MVQAARSGRQNIAEGSMAAATSKKTELKLTNVAKASLEELLLDYEDYLRQNGFRQWSKDDPAALMVRGKFKGYPAEWFEKIDINDTIRDGAPLLDPYTITQLSAADAANTLLCLIHQATYLLARQIKTLEQSFLTEGGFTEQLYHKRSRFRRR